ncbi:MAG: RecQ family ATP-dependent DNA helicase, partial [bacterium]
MVIMPTGGGKSLCYQIPALIFDGLTVVVSPLISLMKDQVEQLKELGVEAVFLNSSLSSQEYSSNVALVRGGKAKLLYVAPETLMMTRTLNFLDGLKIDCLAIDEAHCISEWGHDFRPEYRQLTEVKSRFSEAVCIALTATATERVREDIKNSLSFRNSEDYVASFNRKNLYLQVIPKRNPTEQTIRFLREYPNQSGIIYCFSRRQVDELTEDLAEEGFSVKPYHAGLEDDVRKENQELFIRDDVQIIVATIAFGMGINKPNVRFVVHYDLPKNIESYYQQIGRAGRDGLKAHCLLLFSYGDAGKIRFFINEKTGLEKQVAQMHLDKIIEYCEEEECRRKPILNYFGEEYSCGNCKTCDNCVEGTAEKTDITVAAQKFLSCVFRTDEIFGEVHIIDVLRGSKSQKVLEKGHDKVSTYGIGMEYSKTQWSYFARQFLKYGLIEKDPRFGSLKLTPKAWGVLKNNEPVMGYLKERD